MSADVLRRAAALMRERAEAATPGPWRTLSDGYADTSLGRSEDERRDLVWVRLNPLGGRGDVVSTWGMPTGSQQRGADCTHIASWHPAVALAVADWLDQAALTADLVWSPADGSYPPLTAKALAVARAYLGEDA